MLHAYPTWLIVLALFGVMFFADEIGFRYGYRHRKQEDDESRSVGGTLKGSVFGLVALLLAFSFSATTSRHEIRQRLVLDQANAIGTCYLRAGLLADPYELRMKDALRQYVDLRLELFDLNLQQEVYDEKISRINSILTQLWEIVEETNRSDQELVRTSQIIPAANEVIDLSSTRAWANRNHLPNSVLMLLLVSVILSSLLQGHSSGQSARRHLGLWVSVNIVFALVLFVVLDFDRPRRGFIQVDRTPLVELRESMGE
ncbi:bestrophin-like domain [Lacunimicrobium album]